MTRTTIVSFFIVLSIHAVALNQAWYDAFWWFDIPMHLIGGALVGLFFFTLFTKPLKNLFSERRFFLLLILSIGFASLIGLLWEFYEYLKDVYVFKLHPLDFAPNPNTLPDTLDDLLNDLTGSLTLSLLFLFFSFRKPVNPAPQMR
ncbi:MAG: hypothetical protein HY093_01030 [Candidatus Liptonbacteria bacterium]|nr:hypothetical protein [Candidatus Liptonbacteria bacterium]